MNKIRPFVTLYLLSLPQVLSTTGANTSGVGSVFAAGVGLGV